VRHIYRAPKTMVGSMVWLSPSYRIEDVPAAAFGCQGAVTGRSHRGTDAKPSRAVLESIRQTNDSLADSAGVI
jgi:hypothetical protein